MSPLDAVTLTNFWPGTNSVILRNGYTQHATGIGAPSQVETLMVYNSGSTNTLFAAAKDNKIYDATATGAVGAASLSGLTNDRLQWINFTIAAGSFLLFVNGADKLRGWNGSAWYTDGDGSHDITGLDTATCIDIAVFKHYIWLVPTNSLKAYYLPINAIAGAATALDMSSLFQKGGHIVAVMTWTLDAGYGLDDYLVFITNQGEVLVWRLTDPASPTGIAIIGLFAIGSPIGQRCWIQYAGDLLIITQDGVVPLSSAVQSSRFNPRVSITDKIQYAMSQAITSYGANFGWQLINFPKGNQLYLNVPVSVGMQQQYVQNNITHNWCNFTGWTANCWAILNDNIYFGSNGYVGQAWNGTTDNGAAVQAFGLQSFQAYGSPNQKNCKMLRFHFLTGGLGQSYGNVNVDYDQTVPTAPVSGTSPSYGIWDTSAWDSGVWGSSLVPVANWETATAIGSTFAPVLAVSSKNALQWVATDMVFESGGIL
jgi:hypothetical protein